MRLGRRAREIEEAIDRLLEIGVVVVSVKDGFRFDNQTAMGKFTRQIFASLAELDRNSIVEQTRDGLVRKAREGKLEPAYVRLGYDWSVTTEDGRKAPGAHPVVNPQEADLVRLIFQMYPTMTNRQIVIRLNDQGYRLPCKSPKLRQGYQRRERLFDSKVISDVINDELFTGIVSWGKKTSLQGEKPQEFRHHRPELQLVSFDTFNQIQRIKMERHKVPPRSQGSPYLFSGLVRCPECGGATVGKPERREGDARAHRYACGGYHKNGRSACKGWSAYEQTVKKGVVAFLADLLENKLGIREYLTEAARDMERDKSTDRSKAFQSEITTARMELDRIQDGYVNDIFTMEEAKAKSLDTRARIERAESKLGTLESTLEVKGELAKALNMLEVPLETFLSTMPGDYLTRLCRSVFENFSIRASGYGPGRRAYVEAYTLTPVIRQALADSAHFDSLTPRVEGVRSSVPSLQGRVLHRYL